MATTMHVCNPYCGICKPPKESALICPECNAINDPEKGEFDTCKRCGGELPPRKIPEPTFCNKYSQMCARPCGRARQTPITSEEKCPYHTPVDD